MTLLLVCLIFMFYFSVFLFFFVFFMLFYYLFFFFFFQAEDGIRDLTVTGVQTCALPISGLTGVSVIFTPKGWSASSMALAIAAGGEMAPPSPSLLMPSGLRGDGYSDRKSVV